MAENMPEVLEAENARLTGWLERLVATYRAVEEMVGTSSYVNGAMKMQFDGLPKGTVIKLTPKNSELELEGGEPMQDFWGLHGCPNFRFSESKPFIGGTVLRGWLRQAEQHFGPGHWPLNAPRFYALDVQSIRPESDHWQSQGDQIEPRGVTIPAELLSQVAIAVIDGSIEPILPPYDE